MNGAGAVVEVSRDFVDATSHAVLKFSVVTTLRPANEKTKTAACTVARTDVADVVLGPATAPGTGDLSKATSFAGSLSYQYAPTEGSSCDDQLLDSGGDFAALPCSVTYTVAATRTGDAK